MWKRFLLCALFLFTLTLYASAASGTEHAISCDLNVSGAVLMDGTSDEPLSWGVAATHMDEYAASLKARGIDREVIVAEIGSGVDADHPFLSGRLVAGYDFVESDNTPQDEHGHSTHLAGIIADCTRGTNVKIMSVRVLDKYGTGTPLTIANGIRYAVDNGANVICLALGFTQHMTVVEAAVQYAVDKGVTVVVAACNYSVDASEYCPAHMENCITVAALDKNLKRWDKSNYGTVVDIAAPGEKINSSMPGGKYQEMSGTSMATPFVAAAAALLMCERGTSLTPYQVSYALKNAAQPLPEDTRDDAWTYYKRDNPGAAWTDFLGAGMLDMRAFIPKAEPLSWGVAATHIDEYAALLQKRGIDREVIVAEIGTGVDADHPFLSGRLVAGYDFVEGDNTPQDENGHSTHVAGIIADCTRGTNIKIMPVRVLDASGFGYTSVIVQGIKYAADHGADVICLGLGGNHNDTKDNAIQYAVDKGVTVVVAAGNNSADASAYCPAHVEDCITAAAVDKNLKRCSFSNYGDVVDIAAPGDDISSTVLDGKYTTMSGTSQATSFVAAAAALLIADKGSLTPQQVSDMLKSAAQPLSAVEADKPIGAGVLDMRPFVQQYTVTFNANGGTVNPSSITVTGGDSYGTLPTPTRANYRFDGWFTAADGGTQITSDATVSGNQTLYAHWTYVPPTYTVTFNANGGGGSMSPRKVAEDGMFTLPACEFTAPSAHLEFDGWLVNGTVYQPAQTVRLSADAVAVAQWYGVAVSDILPNWNAAVTVKFSNAVKKPVSVVVCAYSDAGKMLSCATLTVNSGSSADLNPNTTGAAYLKAFLLSPDTSAPLCDPFRKDF